MKGESLAKIFNSVNRGFEETPGYKCFYTFNLNNDQNEELESFGQLQFVNDAFLSPRESITHKHEEDTQVVILPITGALNYKNDVRGEELVRSEQIKIVEIEKGLPYTFNNPFENSWINYLHIGFKTSASHKKSKPSVLQNIEFKKMDELVGIDMQDQATGYIGIYRGRSKGNYTLKNSANGVFVYVIQGAFEVQGRLLESRDGLSLWNTREIEFEALANNAIIMLLEMELK